MFGRAEFADCSEIHQNTQMPCDHNVQLLNAFWRRRFFKIYAHSVFKMLIIQEPHKVALWNKRHFEEKKRRL
jgi:hypothetical protein